MSDDTNIEGTVSYEKGTWQDTLDKSAKLFDRSQQGRKRASNLLWQGAQNAITGWLPSSGDDVSAEGLYNEVLEVLGTSRKGDVSKIKTVALAVRNHGLELASYPNLSKAYSEATRLTKTVKQERDEDDAAEKAIEGIEAPKTTSSVDGAASLLLSKGLDGAVVAILDALNGPSGKNNEAAHRAFMRAVSTEIAARVQAAKPKPAPKVKAEPKEGATKAKATVKDGSSKTKAKVAKGSPKGAPAKAAPKAKAAPVKAEPKGEPAEAAEAKAPAAEETVAPQGPVQRAVPVPKRAVPVKR